MTDLPRVRTHPWHNLEHHRPEGGYRNIWPDDRGGASFGKAMSWFLSRRFDDKKSRPPKDCKPDLRLLDIPPDGVRFCWIGHSTMLVQTPARGILLDPMFSPRASPFSFAGPRRAPALPLHVDELPDVHVVALSHDHYDHLDERTIRRLNADRNPLYLAPLGVGRVLRSWGAERVLEMDWWQAADVDGIRFHCIPARHFSGRGLFNRNETLWAGWYLESVDGSTNVVYAGDTAYAPHFRQIRERIGRPHVAVLPIGAYLPEWLMKPVHVNPQEALQAFHDLEADHFLPVHWGTFDLADEPLHAPADALRRLIREREMEEQVHLLRIGETWDYP